MADRRTIGLARLVDPEWQWLAIEGERLYEEVEIGSAVLGMSIVVLQPDGSTLVYGVSRKDPTKVRRWAFTDDPSMLREYMNEVMVDLTPPQSPGES